MSNALTTIGPTENMGDVDGRDGRVRYSRLLSQEHDRCREG